MGKIEEQNEEIESVRRIVREYNEFEKVHDPECQLPELAGEVHGIIGELCEKVASLRKELNDAKKM